MSHWDRKRAGLLCDAVLIHLTAAGDGANNKELVLVMHRAKVASTTDQTNAHELADIHSALCAYCTRNSLFDCKGHQYQPECAFMESALGLRTSQFGGLS